MTTLEEKIKEDTKGKIDMSNYRLVPVELLKDWHERINTIAVGVAFNVADEMEVMLAASPAVQDVSTLVEALEIISNTDPDDGTAWFHEIADKALAAYYKQQNGEARIQGDQS